MAKLEKHQIEILKELKSKLLKREVEDESTGQKIREIRAGRAGARQTRRISQKQQRRFSASPNFPTLQQTAYRVGTSKTDHNKT